MQATAAHEGSQSGRFRLESPAGVVRRRVPELAIGVVLIGLGAIAVLVLTSGDDAPTEVVVLTADVSRGDPLGADDVGFVGMTADAPVNVVLAEAVDGLIGEIATADLYSGSFLSDAQVAEFAPMPAGFVELGVQLAAGAYPSANLRAGDRVDVLALPVDRPAAAVQSDADSENPNTEIAEVVAGSVEVSRLQPLGTEPGADVFVSLLIPDEVEGQVAAVAGAGRIWLVEVPS